MKEERISAQEVAKALNLNPAKLINWQKKGILPPAPRKGKKRYYTEEYLEEAKKFLEQHLFSHQVKKLLGIGESRLAKLIRAGLLRIKKAGRLRVFFKDEVEELQKQSKDLRMVIKEKVGFSKTDVAQCLGVSRQTLYTWLRQGVIKPPLKNGRPFFNNEFINRIKEELAPRIERAQRMKEKMLSDKK